MENKINEQNQVCLDEDIEVDEGFETYRAILQNNANSVKARAKSSNI